MTRRWWLASAASLAVALLVPPVASAHGLVGRTDLPIPDWLFGWAAAAVLILSFVGLAVLWPSPRLQEERARPFAGGLGRVLLSRPVELVSGAIGIGLFVLTIYSGLAGEQIESRNWAPTFVYVGFWVGLVIVSALFGDVFRAFNPWRAIGRLSGWIASRITNAPEPLAYPRKLGYWPAAAGLFAFAWLELVTASGNDPSNVAVAALVYSAFTFIGMALFGVEAWSRHGEAFGVYFGLFARISPLTTSNGRLALRKPLSGLPQWPVLPGAVALLAVMIGTVSFDGLASGKPWGEFVTGPLDWLTNDVGLAADRSATIIYAAGMIFMVGACALLYWLGASGVRTVDRSRTTGEFAGVFVHTLVPIALAYVVAHYISYLLYQGQALAFLASDPLGHGSNLFGTANWSINYTFISSTGLWLLQVGFVIAGHVAALMLAHDRALVTFRDVRAAVRSQYYLLVVMIGYTSLALWLLAQAKGN